MKKRILSLVLTLALAFSLAVPAMAISPDLEAPYKAKIKSEAPKWGSCIQLVDFDLDGSPELVMGGLPGSGLFSIFEDVWSYENGVFVEKNVSDYDKLSIDGYDLYRNNTTGAYRIEGSYTLRAGRGHHSSVTAYYTMYNDTVKVTNAFVEETVGTTYSYYVNGSKVTKSKYNSAYNARNNGWSKVWSYDFSQYMSPYTNAGKPSNADIQKLFDDYKGSPALAVYSTHKITVDDAPVGLTAYNINGNNYFKLRDLAALLNGTQAQFQVGWNDAARTIILTTDAAYTAVGGELAKGSSLNQFGVSTDAGIYVDGAPADLGAYNINDNNYFKLRDLGKVLGFNVGWDDATHTVSIMTDQPYSE